MLTPVGPGLKPLDFGLAKVCDLPRGPEERTATGTGAILGTPAYMAPEPVEGARDLTAAVDVYAVGVVLFVLLAGRHPFDEKTPWGVAYSRMCIDAPDLRTLSPEIPADLEAMVSECLRKPPGERPSSADLALRLAAFADARSSPDLETLPSGVARHPGLVYDSSR